MYFKEKEDTNIDKEFEKNKKGIFNLKKIKPIYLIISGIVILIIIVIIIIAIITGNSGNYTIQLEGAEKIILTKNSDYIEPGYIAYDKKNNDVTNQVKVISNVNTSTPGEYEIVYSINGINVVRYVTVTEEDTYIYLKGNISMRLKVGEKYIEPGYEVYDSIDRDLTNKVKVSGTVDTSKSGTYQITYTVVNSRGVTITKKRIVTVE